MPGHNSRVLKKKRRKIKFSKVIVTAVLLSVAAFTVAMTVCYWQTGGVPDSLIAAFFAFAGGEAGVLGLIKFSDSKYTKPGDQQPDPSPDQDDYPVG